MKEIIEEHMFEAVLFIILICATVGITINNISDNKKTERIAYTKAEAFKSCVVNNNPAECALAVEGLK